MTSDDLSRRVYCVLGMPIDVGGMSSVLGYIKAAAASRRRLFISTPNVNFLVKMQSDPEFRESLLQSDFCSADGMPIVWIARLFGVPIENRVAGSDIFEALKAARNFSIPLKVFLFGGAEGVAAEACRRLNAKPGGLYCVGWDYPGFGPIDGMSRNATINKINSSGADFLVVSLGAKNGQSWLLRNQDRISIPVISHLGAVLNFQAGTIRRAPRIVRTSGFEWLWRIKQEPYLWKRYWDDGLALFRLLLTHVVPLVIWTRWLKLGNGRHEQDLVVTQAHRDQSITLSLSGAATAEHVDKLILAFRNAIAIKKHIVIDFSGIRVIDARFLGLLLMIRKKLNAESASASFVGLTPRLERIFRLNCLDFLLNPNKLNLNSGMIIDRVITSVSPVRLEQTEVSASSKGRGLA
jgi:N-acetylglucosaminyldiphosphoundecaprenol N-acetyl-beta-D-mannosaminyltransferase